MTTNYAYSKALTVSQKLKLAKTDIPYFIMLTLVLGYLSVTQPVFVCVLGCASLVAMGAIGVVQTIPVLEKQLRTRIKFWHIASLILSATAVFGTFGAPAQAIFLSGLQAFMQTLATGAGQGIAATTIDLIFSAFRGIFLLLVGASTLFAFNQAQQGNDWRPIATQIGLAFGIVIALDVITFLFIGDGGGVGP